jgi:hypothetical protein
LKSHTFQETGLGKGEIADNIERKHGNNWENTCCIYIICDSLGNITNDSVNQAQLAIFRNYDMYISVHPHAAGDATNTPTHRSASATDK